MNIRVGTYNLAGAIDAETRFYRRWRSSEATRRIERAERNLNALAAFVGQQNIDILALQELDVCHNGRNSLEQAAYLAHAASMNQVFLPGFDYTLGWLRVTTGVATLCRYPIVGSAPIEFPTPRMSWPRRLKRLLGSKKALHTTYQVGSRRLHVVNAHLTHDSDIQKEAELEVLMEYCSSLDPCLLMGDLNTTPEATRSEKMLKPHHFATDRCMNIFDRYQGRLMCDSRVFDARAVSEICTHPTGAPSVKLDYILLFTQGGALRLQPEQVERSLDWSNHCLVTADLHCEAEDASV